MSLQAVSPYLSSLLGHLAHIQTQAKIRKGLLKAQNLRTNQALIKEHQKCVLVQHGCECAHCGSLLKGGAVKLFRGVVTCVKCADKPKKLVVEDKEVGVDKESLDDALFIRM